ncbi:MAG: D-alanyl-D-alanine carboxypeptidase/D-alanyl-D-alanine-endopeptidase [Chlorobi bacterium]|nr:D-alanyl-D-alanine carboxypeptidase/D-alanyl-D-alanine-endopeptidase [Chlorobiota bacterium]
MKQRSRFAQPQYAWLVCITLLITGARGFATVHALLYTGAVHGADSSRSPYHQLADRIAELLSNTQLRTTRYGLCVYSLDRDTTVFARGIHELLTPASLTKLYYTAAAFATMGPDYPVRTVVVTDGKINRGIIDGNVYLVGYGDCLLTNTDIEALADKLRSLGIRRIRGAIVADATYFDAVSDRQEYSGDTERMENLPPITALGMDRNTLTVIITRGNRGRVRVHTVPRSSSIVVDWSPLPLVSPRQQERRSWHTQRHGDRIVLRQRPRKRQVRTSAQTVRISSTLRRDGVQDIHVFGMPRANSSTSFSVVMLNPPLTTAGVLLRCLDASGITVEGGVTSGQAPQGAIELLSWERPLHALVDVCNKNSDNFVAEHIMKIVGSHCCGNSACNINAYHTVVGLLDSLGIPSSACTLYDGSGLSRRNRVTTASLMKLLQYCARQSWGDRYFQTLAIAGTEGTLLRRMRRTVAENNLAAKTGTHRNVSGLAGIVRAQSGERFLFAALWNGNNVGLYKRLENQLGELLAGFGNWLDPASDASQRE